MHVRSMRVAVAALAVVAATTSRNARADGSGVDESALDRKADACEDFFQFACGGWLAKTEIPADKPEWSRSFSVIAERNKEIMRKSLDAFAAGKSDVADADGQRLGNYYAACMDEPGIERDALAQLKRRLAPVEVLATNHDLALQLAREHLEGGDGFFDFSPTQDLKNSSEMIGEVDQGGLGLPDRDYYLAKTGDKVRIRKLYGKYITQLLALVGDSAESAQKTADAVLRIETALAQAAMSRVDRRDPENTYHRINRDGLEKAAPHFDWATYFGTLGQAKLQALNVTSPKYFQALDALLQKTSLPDARAYMRWHLVSRAASLMPKKFVDTRFKFTSAAFTGSKELPLRWKRCVDATLGGVGEPLARVFVKTTFGDEGKAATRVMIQQIEDAFGVVLTEAKWMDPATVKEAEAKRQKVFNQVGFPDTWRDFSGLKVVRNSYLLNALEATAFDARYHLAKIGKPVDRKEWDMLAPEVNAYYSPENNKMVFPAGILQPPFYDRNATAAMNFGAIGVVMGHELTHGFDDQGRKYDADGNLREWWSPDVAKKFEANATCLADEYSGFVEAGEHVNGRLTLGENIADQGGVRNSFAAFSKLPDAQGAAIGGFTPQQQFFLGFAQSWCEKMRPELARMLITTNPHSPSKYRVNGTLMNIAPFAQAFSCKPGSKMVPAKACNVW